MTGTLFRFNSELSELLSSIYTLLQISAVVTCSAALVRVSTLACGRTWAILVIVSLSTLRVRDIMGTYVREDHFKLEKWSPDAEFSLVSEDLRTADWRGAPKTINPRG